MKSTADEALIPADTLHKQAWVWLRRLKSGDVKPWDAQAFQRWLRTSPAHKTAFNDAKRRWKELGPAATELLRIDPQAAAYHARVLYRPRLGRRAFLGAAASVAAAAGVAVAYPPMGLWAAPGEWRADYRTATGEQQEITLPGSVRVTLNTQTSIRRRTQGGDTNGIDLLAGEAAFDLPAASPAFSVGAGAGRSRANGGRFEVRFLSGKVCVTCVEGSVQVRHPAGERTLQARQQTVYDEHALGAVAQVDTDEIAAWRSGELVFVQTRLAAVVDEINRYRPGRILLMNAAAGDKPVSGSFFIASLDTALSQLQHTFNLHARSLPGGLLVLT